MSHYFTPTHVVATFKVTLSSRYKRFLTQKEWKKYDGRWADLPGYAPLRAHLQGAALESFFHDDWPDDDPSYGHPSATEVRFGGKDGWVPLATLGDEEPQFLVVKATEATCPVAMWEHESGRFIPCSASLDASLAGLGKTKGSAKPTEPVVGIAKLSKVAERGIGLLDGRVTKKRREEIEAVLAQLEPMMKQLPSGKALKGGEYHGLPSRAIYAQSKMLRAVGRIEEACDVLENAVVDGVNVREKVDPETLCDMLLNDLDRPEKVIVLCETQTSVSFLQCKTWALALFRLGKIDVAAKMLNELLDARVSETMRLDPTKDRARETAKRLDAIRESVTTYAQKRDLTAQAKQLFAQMQARRSR